MNNDRNDAQRSAAQEALPSALLDMHQRLLEDGAAWRDDLPLGAPRAAQALAEPTKSQRLAPGRNIRMSLMTQPPTMPRRDVSWTRRLVASAAILVVVGLLTALFATFARGRNEPRHPPGHESSPTSVTFLSTPGPASKYIVNVVPARAVDSNFTPIDVTSHFPVNAQVHLFIQVRNVSAGEKHTVSVRWYLNGVETQENNGPGRTSVEVRDNSNVHFALVYSTAGVGMAKVYWDRPSDNTSDSDTDPSLAQTIFFTIERQS